MRACRVDGPGGDDRLVARAVGTELAHADLQLVAHLRLGATFETSCHDVGERCIGDPARLGHAGDLAGILAPALGLDDTADRDERWLEQP